MWAREGLVRFNSQRQGRAGPVHKMFASIRKSVSTKLGQGRYHAIKLELGLAFHYT